MWSASCLLYTSDIIDEAYETCRRTLTEHIDQLHALAKALMEREKLNEEQFNTIMAGGTLPPCEDAKPEQAQPDQTVQPAPVPVSYTHLTVPLGWDGAHTRFMDVDFKR